MKAHQSESATSASGGSGSPPWCITPADVQPESAHTSSAQAISFRIEDSPCDEGLTGDGRAPAVTLYPTPEADEDRTLFRSLAENSEFDRLSDFCRERLLQARDPYSSLRWQNNAAIVKALQCQFGEAYELLASASYVASLVEGSLRGRYENEFGLVLVEFGRPLLALDRFDFSLEHHRGDPLACGQVWNNKAVALDALGEPSEALRCAANAIELLQPTGDAVSLDETKRTARMIVGKVGIR
jgi:tetratricopeptide (TPR) repeat protein